MEASCPNTYSSTYVKTPNYPSSYGHSKDCTWKISAPDDKRIRLNSFSVSIERHAKCQYDYLKIYDGSSSNDDMLAFLCGSQSKGRILSSGKELFLHFHSDSSENANGFKIYYDIINWYLNVNLPIKSCLKCICAGNIIFCKIQNAQLL